MSSTTYAATLRRRCSPIRTYPRRNACKLAFTLPTRNPAARLHDSWWSTLSDRSSPRSTANPSFFCERLLPYLCVLFPYPTLLASRARYGKRYEACYSLEIATGTKNAARLHSPRINGRISRARAEYEAPPLSSPCLSPKDYFWRVAAALSYSPNCLEVRIPRDPLTTRPRNAFRNA